MTNEEKIAVLEDAEERGWNLVPYANPATEEYGRLLSNLSQTRLYIECLSDPEAFKPADQWQTTEQPLTTPERAEPVPEATKSEPVGDAPVEQVTPIVTTDDPKPAPAYDKKQLVEMMKTARRNGINVSQIIRAFGVDNLGDIPEDQYPAVVEQLKKEGAI